MATSRTRPNRHAPRFEALEARALMAGDGGLLIGFATGTAPALELALISRLRPISSQSFQDGPVYVEPSDGVNLGRVTAWLRAQPAVLYVEADAVAVASSVAIRPNDPLFGLQWGLDNQGNGIDVNAPEAWSATTGSPDTIIAVIDSGLDLGSPDFNGRIWINQAEYGGRPGVDDDRDGYVDDYWGWNFRDNNLDLTDQADHGTHVTSILAATGNDGNGVAGVNWQAKIMPLKFMGANGKGSISDAIRAIYFAVDHGARVINASWGTSAYSKGLDDAIGYANRHNVVFATAAGNESADNDRVPSYPALDRKPNLLSVAAIDRSGQLASFSNYGASTVDIAAPGVSIRGDVPGGSGSASYSGTSMATPFVAGVASLLIAQHPNWTAAQVVHQIVATARPLPTLTGRVISGGVVDGAAALGVPVGETVPAASGIDSETPDPGSSLAISAYSAPGDDLRVQILASPEYYQAHGGTPAGYVDALYRAALERPAAVTEIQSWSSLMAAGADRAQIAAAIFGSVEARRTKVARWFLNDLGWNESLEFLKNYGPVVEWTDRLGIGVGESAIRSIILGSQEYYDRAGGLDTTFLDALYQTADARPVTPDESAVWRLQLRQGTGRQEVAHFVLSTNEARRLRVALWYSQDLQRPTPLSELVDDPGVIGWASIIND